MLVSKVRAFISNCATSNPNTDDAQLHSKLSAYFGRRSENDKLVFADYSFIINCYRERSLIGKNYCLVDNYSDYTMYPDGINAKWVEFAKELTQDLASKENEDLAQQFTIELSNSGKRQVPKVVEQHYIYLLFPAITNVKDCNTDTDLSEIQHIEHFYLGSNGTLLYGKRSLCAQLVSQKFKLATYRSQKTLTCMTIDELARLKLNKSTQASFKLGPNSYTSFWEFLKKKCFPILQSWKRGIPNDLYEFLGDLTALINYYFELKREHGDIKLFQARFNQLCGQLYKRNIDVVNYIYGIRVNQDESEPTLMLDSLIAMHTANSFNIDNELVNVAKYLYSFHNVLKCREIPIKLAPFYSDESKVQSPLSACSSSSSSSSSSSASSSATNVTISASNSYQQNENKNIWRIIVSLFVRKFTDLGLVHWASTQSIWDKANVIPSSLNHIFTEKIENKIQDNRAQELENSYHEIKNAIVAAKTGGLGMYKTYIRNNSINEYITMVEKGTYEQHRIYWFEPEVYLESLYKYRTVNSDINFKIKTFLDDIVATYGQSRNSCNKMVRVNIRFAEFICGLNAEDSSRIIMLLEMRNTEDRIQHAIKTFPDNCIKYMSRRLAEVGLFESDEKERFISCVNISESYNKLKANKSIEVKEILECFSTKLESLQATLNPESYRLMTAHLKKITDTVYTLKENDKVNSNSSDRLGSAT